MSAGQAFYAKMKSVAEVIDLIGSGDDIRVYPCDQPPENRTYPLVVYQGGDDEGADHYAAGVGDLVRESLDIAVVAETYAEARALHRVIQDAIDGQGGVWGWITVQGCFKEGGSETQTSLADTDRHFIVIESNYLVCYEKPAS
jgi:hypothetical protein